MGFWGYMTYTSNTSQNWRFGFNYTDWSIKNCPLLTVRNELLTLLKRSYKRRCLSTTRQTTPHYLTVFTGVFKYDQPNDTTFPHSIYLLGDFQSFQNCDLRRAKKIGDVNEGGGDGFRFVLKRWHDGIHCKVGLMKFAVWPLIRSFY
ncbi:uncharacterized protein LOC121791682 [Salvia splendens]|uniref:uncharacterized protein LOC121791682 n=1 Tax=Salvia splendens TaxID=180675 RepID=UPI001C260D9C|nr:uncharacterized protein LOC121791682 [Salvia splendens]